jgi:hypothetical protein
MRYRILRLWLVAAAVLPLLPATGSAQQTYRITLKEPARDELALYRKTARFRIEARMEAPKGEGKAPEGLTQTDMKTHTLVYLEKVLEKPAGASKATKLRRRYRQAERTANGKSQPLAYMQNTVLIERQDGSYKFRIVDGAELSGDLAKELDEEFNKKMPQLPPLASAWLLPKAAVKMGESWTVDPAPFVGDLGDFEGAKLKTGKASARAKLLRTHRREGQQFGVLELYIEVPILSFAGPRGEQMKLKKSTLVFRIVADACIDGSSFAYRLKGTMEFDLEGTLEGGGMSINLRARLQGDYFESRQEAAKE